MLAAEGHRSESGRASPSRPPLLPGSCRMRVSCAASESPEVKRELAPGQSDRAPQGAAPPHARRGSQRRQPPQAEQVNTWCTCSRPPSRRAGPIRRAGDRGLRRPGRATWASSSTELFSGRPGRGTSFDRVAPGVDGRCRGAQPPARLRSHWASSPAELEQAPGAGARASGDGRSTPATPPPTTLWRSAIQQTQTTWRWCPAARPRWPRSSPPPATRLRRWRRSTRIRGTGASSVAPHQRRAHARARSQRVQG